jgi:hypothetical protein
MATLDLTPSSVPTEDRTRRVDAALDWSPGTVHWFAVVAFVVAHALLGIFSDLTPPPLASLHAFATIVIAIWLVGIRRNVEAMACIAAYFAACDVFWRMTEASVPWEISKLALIIVFTTAIVRLIRRPRRIGLPLFSLLLLVPSAVVTVERFGILGNGRERLSFELGAHVALILGVICFSNLRIERQTLAGLLWVVIGPVVAVNTIATAGTIGLQTTDFAGNLSNSASSGGYGPNQVSALIGVGAMMSIFLVFFERRPVLRVMAMVLAIWFLAQSALTFSRGGSFNLVVALVVATPFFLRTAQMAVRFLTVLAVGALIIAFAMVPIIQSITGNQFGQRFTSSDPTLRGDLMRSELDAWYDNLALGVGVGMMERTVEDQGAATRGELPKLPTHTEYTRLLAEHGVLGIGVILVLIALAVRGVRRQRLREGRIFSVILITWVATEVAHSATRLALVSFLFALASLEIVPDGTLESGRDLPGTAKGEGGVEPDGPPAVARPALAQHGAGDAPSGRRRSRVEDAAVGEPVQGPGGAPA